MPIAELNHQGIYFEDSGGPGPVLILGHGFLMDGRMFDAQAEALAPEFRVIRWDARGFGRTRWDGQPFSLYDSAADCIALLDHLGIQRAVVGGLSQGGYCALRVALRYPERVRGLVLMSTSGSMDGEQGRAGYRQVRDLWGTPGAMENILQLYSRVIIGDSRFLSPWLERWRQTPKAAFVAATNNLLERDDIEPRLGEIRCPAIVFHGLADAAIPVSEAQVLVDALGGRTRYVPIPGAAHAPTLTHPELLNPPLVEFMREFSG
ncbi:hydrolase, alpha/beta fold having protein [Cystobacter fuscus DSM 2262]|uniref:Hydrolase, alpha/beta fold having protein n=1 Tax=Cystobacter fuscus (strain ATCC 25194 / DSM 2262 / NBRC 100088 / M29) TaxID=1242864 RepID=S9QQ43_CYSF2|nr:alpha/beta fold hydrolase [Cystobacter fuscus]EPX58713.1 hydrolase, alpha/beta fold having protein [Cystobacter fuscus DSM 2262]